MTPSGISTSVSAGLETPDMIELRKRKTQIESDMDSLAGAETPALYKILPEKAAHVGASMMGSSKTYDITAAKKASLMHEAMISGASSSATGIDMTLNPEELDMDTDALQSKFDQQMKQNANGMDTTELTEDQKQKKKKKPQVPVVAAAPASADKDKNKKYKEFKF